MLTINLDHFFSLHKIELSKNIIFAWLMNIFQS